MTGAARLQTDLVSCRLRRGALVALGVGFLLWGQSPVALGAPPPGFSMMVSPTRMVVPLGTASTTQKFEIRNKGGSAFTVTVEKADFTAADSGALNFLPTAPYGAADWVTAEPAVFRMAAGSIQDVTVRIAEPPSPEPGDHQLALIFKVPAGRNADNIRINRGIAAPIYLTVPGHTDDSTGVTALRAPGFALDGPVSVTTQVRDYGTVHRDFRGHQRLSAHIGGTGVQFPDFTVLRGATRTVTTQWSPPLMCVCHATVSIPGPNGAMSAATVRIIVFPLHLAALLIGGLLALVLLYLYRRRRYRAKVLAAAGALHGSRGESDA